MHCIKNVNLGDSGLQDWPIFLKWSHARAGGCCTTVEDAPKATPKMFPRATPKVAPGQVAYVPQATHCPGGTDKMREFLFGFASCYCPIHFFQNVPDQNEHSVYKSVFFQ